MCAERSGLDRLLRPNNIAVVGGGAWCRNVIKTCDSIGFRGMIYPIHPTKTKIEGRRAFGSLDDLAISPDATFLGVNRNATIECLSSLSKLNAGGAVCFASGFAEASAEIADGADLQADLLAAAGDVAVLGPNCYGLLNYLDGAALWPDQHGGERVDSGVAIITQSSNIAINLTMQNRALPIAYVVTAGNQAQTDIADIGQALLHDPRVTCLGLHIEGINDISKLEKLAKLAHELGKPICAVKVGRSDQAQLASVSHTASLAGSHTGATALFKRLGIAQPNDLATFLELLKIWHVAGPLTSKNIASASCSGGEASLLADLGDAEGVIYPALTATQTTTLRKALGPKVALANPLDYHTYIWAQKDAMRQTFSALFDADLGMGIIVLDMPRPDKCSLSDWDIAIEAIVETARDSRIPVGVLASLPDTMPEEIAKTLLNQRVIPLSGMDHALRAISLAQKTAPHDQSILTSQPPENPKTLDENEAKVALAAFGLSVPVSMSASSPAAVLENARKMKPPLVLKGMGFAHKSDAGAVRINLRTLDDVKVALQDMKCAHYLIENMIENTIIEVLLAVTLDPAHGFVLTLGAGGTQTELLNDTVSLLLPVTQSDVTEALAKLRCAPVLDGYRGAEAIERAALWQAIEAVQNYVIAHSDRVQEVEINPLICTATSAIAVDALIVQGDAS